MTDDDNLVDSLADDSTRRSFMKKGTLATAAAGLGVSGAAAARDGPVQEDDVLDDEWKALIFASAFHPIGRFSIVSGVVEWVPNYGDVTDSWFSDYNTRLIRWENTDEVVPLYVAEDAEVGDYDPDLGFVTDADDDADQPQLYEMDKEWTPFGDNPRLITVNVTPVGEDEEDAILDNEDWWIDTDEGTETETPTETP